jgi:hypothetical protein
MVSIPRLGVTSRGWEKSKEIYVLGLAADLRASGTSAPELVAAYNETLPNVVPDVMKLSALQWVVASVSNLFERVRPEQPVSLSGSGIILYPNLDPNGMLALHFVIVECDEGKRNLGKTLKGIFEAKGVKDLVGTLAAGITQPLIALLMNTLIGQIPAVLSRNKDDYLFGHNHSGFDFDDYGVDPGTRQTDFEVGNDRANCTLRVRINP